MNEYEIVESLDRIQGLCAQVEEAFGAAKREGRMPGLEEAKRLDAVSRELLDLIGALPPGFARGVECPELRARVNTALDLARHALKSALPATPNRSARAPRAAPSRLAIYGVC